MAQVIEHQMVLNLFDQTLIPSATNAALKTELMTERTAVNMHLTMATGAGRHAHHRRRHGPLSAPLRAEHPGRPPRYAMAAAWESSGRAGSSNQKRAPCPG